MSKHTPEVGDWVLMKYGFDKHAFYVLEVSESNVKLGLPSWLVSSSKWFSLSYPDLIAADYLGRGRKTIMSRIPILNDIFCPFTKPRNQHARRQTS